MKRIAAVLVMALLVGGLAVAAETTVLKVKVASANVRSEPDINAAVVRQLAAGTLLEAEQMVGDWWEIQVTDKSGANVTAYIHANVVDVVSGGAEPTPEETQPVRQAPPARTKAPAYGGYSTAPSNPGGFKLMAGLGMASLSTSAAAEDPYDKYKKSLTGLVGGLGYESGGTVGLEIDLMYMPKGVQYKGTETSGGVDYTFDIKMRITEISGVALLKFNLPVQGINPFLVGGGEIGYVVQAKYDYTYSGGGESDSGSTDIKKDTASIDYGLVLGGGVGFNLGGMNLSAEVRYHLGLANLDKNPTTSSDTVKSSMFLLMAGIRF
ncbi:MAG: SH3 domain-containing protein [Candidatus Aminicenantales bacterium]